MFSAISRVAVASSHACANRTCETVCPPNSTRPDAAISRICASERNAGARRLVAKTVAGTLNHRKIGSSSVKLSTKPSSKVRTTVRRRTGAEKAFRNVKKQ